MLVKIVVDFSYYRELIYCINGIFDIAIHLALQTSHHLKGDTSPSRLDKKLIKFLSEKLLQSIMDIAIIQPLKQTIFINLNF